MTVRDGARRRLAALRRRTRNRLNPQTLDALGAAAGLSGSAMTADELRSIERAIEESLDGSTPRSIVLIVAAQPGKLGAVVAKRYHGTSVHVLDVRRGRHADASRHRSGVKVYSAAGIDAMQACMFPLPSKQVVIERGTGERRQKTACFQELLFHVDDGGVYIVAGLDGVDDPVNNTGRGPTVTEALDRLIALKNDPDPAARENVHPDDLERINAIESVSADQFVTVVRKRGRHLTKLRDADAEKVLTGRLGESWGRRLETRAPVTVAARGTVHANERLDSFRTTMDVPELYLREYLDVVCAPRGLVVQDGVLLPISFHHGLRKRMQQASSLVVHASRDFATVDSSLDRARHLPGTYFHLDSEFPGHFGHFITEDIAKLWGWSRAREEHPELKALISVARPGERPKKHQLALLGAWGIPAEDVVCIDAPARVDTLVGASQMFYNGVYVHPELTGVWDGLRDALRTPTDRRSPSPRRIFVTRPPGSVRPCRNAPEVEEFFLAHGFTIVRPEESTIPEQVDLFADADIVAGFGGSGLFNTIYGTRPGRRIVIASTEYRARNEWTVAAMKGDDYHHFFCRAEIAHPDGQWVSKAFHSPYSFDFARDGAALRALVSD